MIADGISCGGTGGVSGVNFRKVGDNKVEAYFDDRPVEKMTREELIKVVRHVTEGYQPGKRWYSSGFATAKW